MKNTSYLKESSKVERIILFSTMRLVYDTMESSPDVAAEVIRHLQSQSEDGLENVDESFVMGNICFTLATLRTLVNMNADETMDKAFGESTIDASE